MSRMRRLSADDRAGRKRQLRPLDEADPYFVVCGSRNTVRDGDEVELRPSVAAWIRRICGKCIGRFGVRSAYATASNPKNDASVHTPTHTAAKLPPARSVPLLKSRAVLAETPPAGSVYFDARPRSALLAGRRVGDVRCVGRGSLVVPALTRLGDANAQIVGQ